MTLYNIVAKTKFDDTVNLQFRSLKEAMHQNPGLKEFRLVGVVKPDEEF